MKSETRHPLGSAMRLQLAPTERLVVDGNGRQPFGRTGRGRGWTSLAPTCQDGLAVSGFNLLSKAPPVKTEQRIVCRIGGTAERISSEHYPIPEIYCAENGRQYADIGFGAGNHQGIRPALSQQAQ